MNVVVVEEGCGVKLVYFKMVINITPLSLNNNDLL
jgi:hypothetical protein